MWLGWGNIVVDNSSSYDSLCEIGAYCSQENASSLFNTLTHRIATCVCVIQF